METIKTHITKSEFRKTLSIELNKQLDDILVPSMHILKEIRNLLLKDTNGIDDSLIVELQNEIGGVLSNMELGLNRSSTNLERLFSVIKEHALEYDKAFVQAQVKERFITLESDTWLLRRIKSIKRKWLWRASHAKAEMSTWDYVMKSIVRYKKRYKQRIQLQNLFTEHFADDLTLIHKKNQRLIHSKGSLLYTELDHLISLIELYFIQNSTSEESTISKETIKKEIVSYARNLKTFRKDIHQSNERSIDLAIDQFFTKINLAATVEYPSVLFSKPVNWFSEKYYLATNIMARKWQSRTLKKRLDILRFKNSIYHFRANFDLFRSTHLTSWNQKTNMISQEVSLFFELNSSPSTESISDTINNMDHLRVAISSQGAMAQLELFKLDDAQLESWITQDVFIPFTSLNGLGILGSNTKRYLNKHFISKWNSEINDLLILYKQKNGAFQEALDFAQYQLEESYLNVNENKLSNKDFQTRVKFSIESLREEYEHLEKIAQKITEIITNYETDLTLESLVEIKAKRGIQAELHYSKEQFSDIWEDVESSTRSTIASANKLIDWVSTKVNEIDNARIQIQYDTQKISNVIDHPSELDREAKFIIEEKKWRFFQPDYDLQNQVLSLLNNKSEVITISGDRETGKTMFLENLQKELCEQFPVRFIACAKLNSFESLLAILVETTQEEVVLIDDLEILFAKANNREQYFTNYLSLIRNKRFRGLVQSSGDLFIRSWMDYRPGLFGTVLPLSHFNSLRAKNLKLKLKVLLGSHFNEETAAKWNTMDTTVGKFVRKMVFDTPEKSIEYRYSKKEQMILDQIGQFKEMDVATLAINCMINVPKMKTCLDDLIAKGSVVIRNKQASAIEEPVYQLIM